jgi:hypothetical protein
MAIVEKTIIDLIEVLHNNTIQVRTSTIIEKDDVEIARTYHRHVITPGDDISKEDLKVQSIANAIWTDEVINAYKASIVKPDLTQRQPNN